MGMDSAIGGGAALIVTLVFLAISLVFTILWVMALVDCLKHDERTYQTVGSSKTTWVLVVVLLGGLGGLIYWFSIRSKLREAAARGPQPVQQYGQQYGQHQWGASGQFQQQPYPGPQTGQQPPQQYGQQPPYNG